MKASLSRNKIINLFDEYDHKLTVKVYSSNGSLIFTKEGLNLYQALGVIAYQTGIGRQCNILKNGKKWDPHTEGFPM